MDAIGVVGHRRGCLLRHGRPGVVALRAGQPGPRRQLRSGALRIFGCHAAGGVSKSAPVATEWGGYIAFVADPDGHVWELAHNPHWPLNDDGSLTLPD